MRGSDDQNKPTFVIFDVEARLPKDHPLRTIKNLVDPILERLSPDFDAMYSWTGRPSIPPEHLLRAMILQTLYSIRSERLLVEEIDFHMAYRWFVGLRLDEPVWDPTVFTKNRDRLIGSDIAQRFFEEVRRLIDRSGVASDEHFSVDGTQLEAWASLKSFQLKEKEERDDSDDDPGNPSVDFKGKTRRNDTHQSRTDPNSRLCRSGKGKEAKLGYTGSVLTENRNGLVMQAKVLRVVGTSEEEAAFEMLESEREWQGAKRKRMTLGADKKYDSRGFVSVLRSMGITPHVAQRNERYTKIDERTTRHPGYVISQRRRKRVEEVFGWAKTVGLLRKLVYRGLELVNWMFVLRMGIYNLVRLKNLGVIAG